MFGKIDGQRLNLAKMHIANYCIALEQQAGVVDVRHVVLNINHEYWLVAPDESESLAADVNYFYQCLVNQQVESVDRGSYWKWRAKTAFEAKDELARELASLQG